MKTPPAASIRLGASVCYRWMVSLSAIFLVAAYALFYWTSGYIPSQFNSVAVLLPLAGLASIAWAVGDAWRPRTGALHYAAGQWVLAQEGLESQGTLQAVVDLQSYILARFTPEHSAPDGHLPHTTPPQWLHLESRHGQDWPALRRALFALPALASAGVPDVPVDAPAFKAL